MDGGACRLQSIGTLGVGQDRAANTFTFILKQLNQNFWELAQSSVFFLNYHVIRAKLLLRTLNSIKFTALVPGLYTSKPVL